MRRRRPIEVLRGVVIELQMAPIKQELSIGMEPYLGIVRSGRTLNELEFLLQCRAAMFERLVWSGRALQAARQTSAGTGLAG